MRIVHLAATLVLVSCTAAPLMQPSAPPGSVPGKAVQGPLLQTPQPRQTRLPQESLIDSAVGQLRREGNQDRLALQVLIRPTGFRTQQLELERISHLRAWVEGPGISQTLFNLDGYVSVAVEDNTNLQIMQVPRGQARVVTVQGYQALQDNVHPPLPGATLKAVYHSPENTTDVELTFTWRSTAVASVVEALIAEATENPILLPLLNDLDLPALETLIDQIVYGDDHPVGGNEYQHHPTQLDPEALADLIVAQQGTVPSHNPADPVPTNWLKSLADLALVVRTPQNTAFSNSDIRIQITDPGSPPLLISNTDTADLPDIIPGSWEAIVHIAGLNGGVTERATVQVNAQGQVTLVEGTSANPIVLPPVLKALSDNDAPAGTEITITGDGFDPSVASNNQVFFGSTPATVVMATATSLVVSVPPGVEGAQNITVTANGKTSNIANFTIPREITRLDRSTAAEGQEVTISLSGYDPTQDPGFTVTFTGGVTAVPVSGGVTPGSITVVVPPGAQTGPITVTPTQGDPLLSPSLTITELALTSVGPNNGAPGDTVTLTGVNLQGATGVTFNGTSVPSEDIEIVDDTTIVVKVPVGATTGPVVVTTPYGDATSPDDFTVTGSIVYLSSYGGNPGSSVTIDVSGVVLTSGNPPTITFNSPSGPIPATNVTVIDEDTVMVKVPTGATTGPVSLTPPGEPTITGPTYYVSQPGIILISDMSGNVIEGATPGQQVIISGANLGTTNQICFGQVCTTNFSGTNTAIVVTVPANATSGPVEVRTPSLGNASHPLTISPPPVIDSLIPPDPSNPNTTIVLQGANYSSVTQVTIGGQVIPPSDYTINSDNTLTINQVPDDPVLGVITVTNPAGTAVASLTYKNVLNFLGNGGTAPNTVQPTLVVNQPHGVNVDSEGNIYVADLGFLYAPPYENFGYSSAIHKFSSTGQHIWSTGSSVPSDWVSNGYPSRYSRPGFTDGTIATSQVSSPEDMANDAAGNIYVADTANHAIRKITTTGDVVTLARVPGPEGIEIDREGRLYVTSNFPPNPSSIQASNTAYVLRIDDLDTIPPNLVSAPYNPNAAQEDNRWTSNVTKIAGGNITLTDPTGVVSPLDSVRFKHLEGLGIDGNGHIYVADVDSYQVRKLDIDNDQATIFASVGASSPTTTQPNIYMHEIRVDRVGNVFVPSPTAGPAVGVYLITPQGRISLIAGRSTGVTGLQDGDPLTEASFTSPRAVDFGPDGSLYVADTSWGIRKIERYHPAANLQMP
ncbi:MAG: IPT/TIG domain-containing protein [Candidatus Sericytochromatia bacterium]